MNGVTASDLDNWFTHHAPTPKQTAAYEAVREAGKAFAAVILAQTPSCPDQTVAIRKVREAVMVANQSIACGGR
jgi:Xaa-Pro aminopeptidase